MVKRGVFHALRMVIILAMVIPLIVSPGQAQTPIPEQPRLGAQAGSDIPRFPPDPTMNLRAQVQSVAAARLPWSKVVFESYRDNNFEIYIANDDGSSLTRLTKNSNIDIAPRLNRGGTKIAFASNMPGTFDIYSINPDGTGLARLTNNNKDDSNPRWSPDGSKIAFQSNRDGNWEVYLMNANGSSQTRLTNNTEDDLMPAWSPDGSKIAWCAYRNGEYRIWVMDANGSGAVQLSSQPYSENPSFSPDGTQIAYDSDGDGDTWQEVWLMNADGSNQRAIYSTGQINQDALVRGWSPDGAWITYTHTYYVNYSGTWYWTDAFLKIVSPTAAPPTETDLLGINLDWLPDWQSQDRVYPTSTLQALPVLSPGPFQVSWNGSDTGGSGFKYFDIQVKDGAGGVWTDWKPATSATSDVYPGIGGHTYYFRGRAWDNAYNAEAWPADYDTMTTVENFAPLSAVNSLPVHSPAQVTVSWSGTDPGGSGIKSYDIQSKDGSGVWKDWLMATTQTSAVFNGTSGHTVAFRARAIDNAFNQEGWAAGNAPDTKSTLVSFGVEGLVMDNTGNPVAAATTGTFPTPFQNPPSSLDGSYGAYVTTTDSTVSVSWTKSGYGPLPPTVFNVPALERLDVALPPSDNVVVNPTLEFSGSLAAPWTGDGVILPTSSTTFHTGATSALVGMLSGMHEPVNLSQLGNPAIAPWGIKLKVEPSGVVHAVWYDNQIYYARRTASGIWSPAVNITQGDALLNLKVSDIIVDIDGNVFVFWVYFRSGVTMARRDPSGSWSAPMILSGDGTCTALTECGLPKVVVDPAGVIHAVWDSAGRILYSERATNGVWTAPLEIQKPNNGSNPFMGMDDAGVIHVVWTGSYDNLLYTQRSSSGAWSTPIEFTRGMFHGFMDGANEMDMKVGHNGVVSVVWEVGTQYASTELSDLYYSQRSVSGAWSTPANISNLPGNARNLIISLAMDGAVHICWETSQIINSLTQTYLYHADQPYGGTWSGAEKISQNQGSHINTTIDNQGVLLAVWKGQGIQSAQRLAGGWTQPEVIGSYGSNDYVVNPVVAVDGTGRAHIVWRNDSGFYVGPRYIQADSILRLSQTVTLPATMTSPVLSFFYQLGEASTANGGRLMVRVTHGTDQPNTVFSTTTNTDGWTHGWFDLSPWAGEEITVSYQLNLKGRQPPAFALVDDVTIGSGSTDVWVKDVGTGTALPSSTITLALAYGNQGVAPAAGVTVTQTLPDQLTYVSANPLPATVNGQVLTWDATTLAGRSGPFTIQVTAAVAADVAPSKTLNGSAHIQTTTAELETGNNTILTRVFVGMKSFIPMVIR